MLSYTHSLFIDRSDDNINNDNNNKRKLQPDHGTSFVPGAGPEYLAPKSLDHFKRGYHERAEQREKEFYCGRSNRAGGGGGSTHNNNNNNRNQSSRRDRPGDSWASASARFERPTILHGFNVLEFLDHITPLSNSGNNSSQQVFEQLDQALKKRPQAFSSGKALTALISSAARRRHVQMAHLVWEWMDIAQLEKNTFHYNSMISATEKAKDYQHALALLREMDDKRVPKNEVTYVFLFVSLTVLFV